MTVSNRSPLRIMATIVGGLLITIGAIALATGEFNIAGVWILAVGLASIGLAGLVSTLT